MLMFMLLPALRLKLSDARTRGGELYFSTMRQRSIYFRFRPLLVDVTRSEVFEIRYIPNTARLSADSVGTAGSVGSVDMFG